MPCFQVRSILAPDLTLGDVSRRDDELGDLCCLFTARRSNGAPFAVIRDLGGPSDPRFEVTSALSPGTVAHCRTWTEVADRLFGPSALVLR